MIRTLVTSLSIAASLTFLTAPASALSVSPRDDNAVVALDARTGERLWAYFPERLSEGHTDLYSDTVLLKGYINTDPQGDFEIGIDPASGELNGASRPSSPPLSSSRSPDEVRLENGWHLSNFKLGYDQDLVFVDDKDSVTWTLATDDYPGAVQAWKNIVIFEAGHAEEDTLYAFEAGSSAPLWTFNPTVVVSLPEPEGFYVRVLGDAIYVSAREHLLELDPATGSVKRQWDLAALTGLPFGTGFFEDEQLYSGLYASATLSADNDTLAVGYERRLIALDRTSGDLLWHADPGSYPYRPYPVVQGDRMVAIAGEGLAGPRPAEPPEVTALDPGGCSFSPSSARGSGSPWAVAALFGALLAIGAIGAIGRRRRPLS
jgi:outer membrane protein assembly factor BamB